MAKRSEWDFRGRGDSSQSQTNYSRRNLRKLSLTPFKNDQAQYQLSLCSFNPRGPKYQIMVTYSRKTAFMLSKRQYFKMAGPSSNPERSSDKRPVTPHTSVTFSRLPLLFRYILARWSPSSRCLDTADCGHTRRCRFPGLYACLPRLRALHYPPIEFRCHTGRFNIISHHPVPLSVHWHLTWNRTRINLKSNSC